MSLLSLMAAGSMIWFALVVLGIVLSIVWMIVPFALIGIKPLLRQLIFETRRTNALLERKGEPTVLFVMTLKVVDPLVETVTDVPLASLIVKPDAHSGPQ